MSVYSARNDQVASFHMWTFIFGNLKTAVKIAFPKAEGFN